MGGGLERKPGGSSLVERSLEASSAGAPGKRTLTEQLVPPDPAVPAGPVAASAKPASHGAAADLPSGGQEPGRSGLRTLQLKSLPELAHGHDVQRKQAAGTPGTAPSVPSAIGAQFGRNFDDVRLHTDAAAHDRVRSLGTEAATEGKNIYFAPGAFDPGSHHGKKVLGHELAHVVQQDSVAGAAPQGFGVAAVGARGTDMEHEASAAGEVVAAGGRPDVKLRASEPLTQRFESREHAELGDQVHSAVGASGAASDSEKQRLGNDKFTDGQRSLSLELRVRDPASGLPTPSGTQNVPVSYGEMIALSGDFYFSVDNLRKAPAQEVVKIRDLIAAERRDPKRDFDGDYEAATAWRRAGVYQPGTGAKEGTKGQYWGVQPGDAGHDNASTYIDLATENNAHFSAATDAIATPDGPEGNAAGDNHQGFLTDHNRAITIATKVREARKLLGLIPNSAAAPAPATTGGPAPAGGGGAAQTKPPAPAAGGSAAPAAAVPAGAGSAAQPPAPAGTGGSAQPAVPANLDDIAAQETLAYVYNAGGDHYLTDAFSAGHLINKAQLASVTDRVLNPAMFETMVESLMPYAMREPAALGLSPNQLGTGGGAVVGGLGGLLIGGPIGALIGLGVGGYGGHKGIQALVRKKLREGLSVFKTDPNLKHNVGAKLVHDYLNASGVKIASKNGRFHYTTMGDGKMDAATKDIAARAVLASRNYIRSLMHDSDADLAQPQNADDAWGYTPNVDVTLFTSKMEPILRAELANTEHLWELMKTAVTVKEARATQDKTEAATAQVAHKDKGGDWGQTPNPRFTRRAIMTNESGHP